jgi:hypothetical protein
MQKTVLGLVAVLTIIVASFAAYYFEHYKRAHFDENDLGLWVFRALDCGRGYQIVAASDPNWFAYDVKDGFIGHARSSGASDEDIQHLDNSFEAGRQAAMRIGFKEGVKLDTMGAEMMETIGSLVNSGCGVRIHYLHEEGWLSLPELQEEITNKLLNR